LDLDCDGLPDPNRLDGDGDGRTPCDGDCDDEDPGVVPGAAEVCNDRDDDCDGRVDQDDPSVDLFTCGFCPDPSGYVDVRARREWVNPCVLDPTVSLCRDGVTGVDTMDDGERLHRVVRSRMSWGHRPELLLYLPPGPGNITEEVQAWGVYAGYRLISLGWVNDGVVNETCSGDPDPSCFDRIRQERWWGVDVSPHVEVAPHDSIHGRLVTLLRWLAATYPDEGWDAYLDGEEVVWRKVVGMGWSEGATMVAYLGKQEELAGAFLLAPGLDLYRNADFTRTPDAWWSRPNVTPLDRVWALHSLWDFQAFPIDHFAPVFDAYGLTEPPVLVDGRAPPYGGAHYLTTASLLWVDGVPCSAHGSVALDGCVDASVLMPAHLHVFCSVAESSAAP
jgi:hypothetical protein